MFSSYASDGTCFVCNKQLTALIWRDYEKEFCSPTCLDKHIEAVEDPEHLYEEEHNHEIGNLIFGNSRGEFSVYRNVFTLAFLPLMRLIPDFRYSYFQNEIFRLSPYYWDECDCVDSDDENEPFKHVDNCPADRANFLHKPTGFEVRWYKYPFRDSYTNKKVNRKELDSIISDCVNSIEKNTEKNRS